MIEYIILRDLQKHRKIKITFSPGVTTLTGTTNAGKSTIIRGLRLACLNANVRGVLIRHGRKSFKILLKVDGHAVGRQKGEKNLYTLDGQPYRAFGMGNVPKDISDLLRVNENNFQRQLDLPFWFADTPGQVSRNLNEIVNLAVIDTTLAAAGKEVRSANAERDVAQSRLAEARAKKKELSWVPAMAAEWAAVEQSRLRAEERAKDATALAVIVREATNHSIALGRLTGATLGGKEAVSAGIVLTATAARRTALAETIALVRHSGRMAKIQLPDILPLVAERDKADHVAEYRRSLEALLDETSILEEELCGLDENLASLSKRLRKLPRPRVCLTCGQRIKSSSHQSATCTSVWTPPPSAATKRTGSTPRPTTSSKSKPS